ncbi:MAG: SLC13 family permease [Alphaproteobacteria bacterium]
MTVDQSVLFGILALVFAGLIWGRWRYDLVAFAALLAALLTGVVPTSQAFSGFGHPAVAIVALVLIISRGLSASGAVELIARHTVSAARSLSAHIGLMAGLAAVLSAMMNNVGALAMLMPVDLAAAAKAKRSPGLTLMPLSFASILGGMITLIGTPPNIIIAQFRQTTLGEPYSMFDFAPVGLVCALVGVVYVATIGWRLIPAARGEHNTGEELFELGGYIAEVEVAEGSSLIGTKVRDLDSLAEENDAAILGLVRRGKRLAGFARAQEIRAGDILVIEAESSAIDGFIGAAGLKYIGQGESSSASTGSELSLIEVAVPEGARLQGRTAFSVRLLSRFGITLLGVSRRGKRFRERVRNLDIEAGDILLLLGPAERLAHGVNWLGCLPLATRGLEVVRRDQALTAVGCFVVAIAAASTGLVYLPVALAVVAVAYVLLNIVPVRDVYESVEWPVIVLLGSMIPIGAALESSGGTGLIADAIVTLTQNGAPWMVLTFLMVVTMTLSDVLNNTATAVIAAPIAVDIATRLGVSPDPFLMTVAVAASCAFLTPIGHKNNTLILGPGGYRFGDYWRMGLPLEIMIVAVSVPVILWVWPF